MAKPKGTAVAKRKAAQVTEVLSALQADAAEFANDFQTDDLAIPRITICQALSPQRKKTDPSFIPGLQEGNIFNTVLQTIYGESVIVIPVAYQKVYNVWRHKDTGGGFVGTYHDENEAQEECPQDADVVDTAEYYLLVQNADGGWDQASLSFKMTGLKVARQWNSLIAARRCSVEGGPPFNPPMFAQVFTLASAEASNDKGSWFTFSVAATGLITDLDGGAEVYVAAKTFREMVQGGLARVVYEEAEVISVTDADGEEDPGF